MLLLILGTYFVELHSFRLLTEFRKTRQYRMQGNYII